jgi:hypothetical protein
MLRLIGWLVSGYLLYQLWTGTRRRRAEESAPRGQPTPPDRERHIDRSQVVDAEFTDLDPGPERRA